MEYFSDSQLSSTSCINCTRCALYESHLKLLVNFCLTLTLLTLQQMQLTAFFAAVLLPTSVNSQTYKYTECIHLLGWLCHVVQIQQATCQTYLLPIHCVTCRIQTLLHLAKELHSL